MDETVAEQWFKRVAEISAPQPIRASSRLKSRIYSALMRAEAAEGVLASLSECEQGGGELCWWEKLILITPMPDTARSLNHCHFCHARILGEQVEGAPVHWRGCPYAEFQK